MAVSGPPPPVTLAVARVSPASPSSFHTLLPACSSTATRATLSAAHSVNHMAEPGPAVMPRGSLSGVTVSYSVITPSGVIRPTLLGENSVNHRLPSGPVSIPRE